MSKSGEFTPEWASVMPTSLGKAIPAHVASRMTPGSSESQALIWSPTAGQGHPVDKVSRLAFGRQRTKGIPKLLQIPSFFLSRFLKCENAWVAYCSGTHILLSTCHNSKSRSSSVAQVLVSTKQHSLGASAQWPVPLGVAPSLRMGLD